VRVLTPYNVDFVDDLKSSLPGHHRMWDKGAGHWLVNEAYLEDLVNVCRKYFNEVVTDLGEEEVTEGMYGELLRACPPANQDKLYAALAFAFHPDRGGDTEIMKQINLAHQNIKECK